DEQGQGDRRGQQRPQGRNQKGRQGGRLHREDPRGEKGQGDEVPARLRQGARDEEQEDYGAALRGTDGRLRARRRQVQGDRPGQARGGRGRPRQTRPGSDQKPPGQGGKHAAEARGQGRRNLEVQRQGSGRGVRQRGSSRRQVIRGRQAGEGLQEEQ